MLLTSIYLLFLSLIIDPVLGSLTALECGIDGLHKLSQMAEEVFGGDIFCSGNKKQKQKQNDQGRSNTALNECSLYNYNTGNLFLSCNFFLSYKRKPSES